MVVIERPLRSIAKAATFRVSVLIADSVIIYFLTHRLDVTLSVMILSNFSSTILFYVHERVWNRIGWGRRPAPSSLGDM